MTGRMQVLQWIIVGRMLQVLSCNFANVWYLVFNVWCVMCDFDVQCLVFDVQCFECGRRECESLWMGLCIGDGVENLFDESVGWGGLRKGSWQNSFKGRHKEKLWKTAVWGVGGSPPPSLTASICEDFDPFFSCIKRSATATVFFDAFPYQCKNFIADFLTHWCLYLTKMKCVKNLNVNLFTKNTKVGSSWEEI